MTAWISIKTDGDNQNGAFGGRLEKPFIVRVSDGDGRPVSGQVVEFAITIPGDGNDGPNLVPVPNTTVFVTPANPSVVNQDPIAGQLYPWLSANTRLAAPNNPAAGTGARLRTVYVLTDGSGDARVYLSTTATTADANHVVTAKVVQISGATIGSVGNMLTFRATAIESLRRASLEVVSGDGQSADKGKYLEEPLVIIARSTAGFRIPNVIVKFEALGGILSPHLGTSQPTVMTSSDSDISPEAGKLPTGTIIPSSGNELLVITGSNGEASVDYNVGQNPSAVTNEVSAEVFDELNTGLEYDFTIDEVIFSINGRTSRATSNTNTGNTNTGDNTQQPPPQQPPPQQPPPATSQASNILIISGNSQVAKVNSPLQPFVVQVNDQTGAAMSGVTVTFSPVGGGNLSSTSDRTDASGRADTTFTLGSTASTYSVRASAVGVTFSQTFTAIAQAPVLSQLQLRGESSRSVYVGTRMRDPLTVRVLDTDSDPVENIQVTFTVVSGGTGTATPLTQSDQSDTDGSATAYFTPTGAGTIMIDASAAGLTPTRFTLTATLPPSKIVKISGDDQAGGPGKKLAEAFVVEIQDTNSDPISGITVTFDVTSGGGSVSPESATTDANGRAQSVLKLGTDRGRNSVDATVEGVAAFATFKAVAGAEVRLDAAKRPPLYWVDTEAGTLHRLTGDRVENLASRVEGVTSIAVDEANGLLYFGVQTGRRAGKIQRSGLNGRNVETLKDGLMSVPMGIALDSAGDRLYWTTSNGKIKSIATAGSTRATNVRQNLANPTSLTVSNGYIYWAEPLGRISRMNLTASQKITVDIATGLDEPLSIAIANGKIYWVEISGSGGGRLQRANLDGTKIEQLRVFTGSVPAGIAIDSSSNKIYWTKSDEIQRANLVGRSATDVVTELISPGAIAIGGALPDAAPVVEQTTTTRKPATQTPTPTDNSKYDVNGDGTVDLLDVFAPILQPSNMKNDVNGDGVVNIQDANEIDANRDANAAAPAIDLDLKALDIDFDRVQGQIEALLASGDMSLETQRALMYLQHLLASARPDATVLLANYPNPFNPETWIPYHLATSTDVGINIYNAQGILVRALTLGHQSAGYYTSRSRAAYWDGRNALGERVASGIYFYQLETDEVSPMRKMVILK